VKDISLDPNSPDYRKTLVKKTKKLKKEGMTLKQIAETFNDEKVLTLSGTGKWYASSINNLLSKK
jgi:intein-encoded DNA endonuclease-like protein